MMRKTDREKPDIKQPPKATETLEREAVLDLLKAFENKDDFPGLLERITSLVQTWSGCRAAGIRLGREGVYPFFTTSGFSTQFLENELQHSLFTDKWPSDSGRDGEEPGACLCRRALADNSESNLLNETEGKSLWTNCLQIPQPAPSGNGSHMAEQCCCQKEGYRSVALIPLRAGGRTIGFFQINDPEPDRLDERKIQHLEDLASILGPIIKKRFPEQAQEQKETQKEKVPISTSFQEKQKMETIGRLAGGIVHDMSNLLVPIRGHCELLAMDVPPENPAQNNIKEIMKAASKADDLIRKVLSVSRKTESEPAPVLLQDTVKDVLKLIRSAVPANVEILQEIDKYCPPVIADPTRLHQVVMNLVKNAIDAVKQNGGTITVSLGQTASGPDPGTGGPDSKPYALLTVSDTGHGIDPAHLDKIFEPYFTTKEAGNGTGLGLPAVCSTIREYGGDVSVNSRPGKGTEFTLYLPCDERGRP